MEEGLPVGLQEGVMTVLYRWAEAPGGAKGIEYLLLRRILNWKGIEFCKGRIDPGETAREAALREVREETGIALDSVEETGETMDYSYEAYDGEGRKRLVRRHFIVFAADITGKNPKADGREHSGVHFAPYEQARELLSFDNTRELLERVHPRLSSRVFSVSPESFKLARGKSAAGVEYAKDTRAGRGPYQQDRGRRGC